MKPERERTIAASQNGKRRFEVVRLAKAEYGSLDTDKLANVRRQILLQAKKPSPPYLVVDLSAVHFLGASFVGILVEAWSQLRKRRRRLVLCGLTTYCGQLIRSLRLDELFEIYSTQAIAVAQIGQHAGNGDRVSQGRGIRVQKSEVEWDRHMLRLEFIGEDNVPLRSIIVPRMDVELALASALKTSE